MDQLESSLRIIALCLVVFTSSQIQEAPKRPERCVGNADMMYRFCCVLPPFFTRDVAKECGARFELILARREFNVTGMRRQAVSRCGHWYCVLDKYALITRDGYLDHEKYYNHLGIWVGMNPDFSEVMVEAKVNCRQTYRSYFPLKPCEFFNFHMCIRNYLTVECPVTLPTKECDEQKEFYKNCGKYFYNK